MFLWILRLVIAYVVVRGLSRLLGGIKEGLRGPRPSSETAVALARDPVCGIFVVPTRALTSGSGDDVRFFCSERCRREYGARRAS